MDANAERCEMKGRQELTERTGSTQEKLDLGRRRFTRAGAGAGAVVATLTSRPVLAGICKSPSGFASGNLSHPGMIDCSTGLSPVEWAAVPAGQLPVNDEFHSVFVSQGTRADWGNAKFKAVLDGGDNANTYPAPNPISKEFVAAYLNIFSGYYPTGLNEQNIRHMWAEWESTGQYQVQPGVFWTADQHIIPYLQSLYL